MPESMKKVPMRRCVGCMESKPQSQLIRIVRTTEGMIIDLEEKSPGRGCYLCRNQGCLEKALKKNGFARSFKSSVNKDELQRLSQRLAEIL